MSGLRAISAILTASAGLDAEQTAPLHLFAAPMSQMHIPALSDEIEERLVVKFFELPERHRVVETLNPKSEI
jgi:hypothetical protein